MNLVHKRSSASTQKVPPAGVELATSSLGRNRSIQLSYGGVNQLRFLEGFFVTFLEVF